jgi:small subunit ribosomal protein S11
MVKVKSKAKKKRNVKLPVWKLYVKTSVNNTLVTLTDEKGDKISWWGTWLVGFKWTKQSTPYAAESLTKEIVREARDSFGLKEIWIELKGLWLGRDWVFKAINDLGWVDILYIRENTGIQFGGCKWVRPKRN